MVRLPLGYHTIDAPPASPILHQVGSPLPCFPTLSLCLSSCEAIGWLLMCSKRKCTKHKGFKMHANGTLLRALAVV